MKQSILVLTGCFSLMCCADKETSSQKEATQTEDSGTGGTDQRKNVGTATPKSISEQLIGSWTNQSSANALFEIGKRTIFYIDQDAMYGYAVDKDRIQIRYPDYTYEAVVSFDHDTLIMDSQKNGRTKYWRFVE